MNDEFERKWKEERVNYFAVYIRKRLEAMITRRAMYV
jgi:hypothetical protein